MIRRPPRSTHCISSAASDVYKRQSLIELKIISEDEKKHGSIEVDVNRLPRQRILPNPTQPEVLSTTKQDGVVSDGYTVKSNLKEEEKQSSNSLAVANDEFMSNPGKDAIYIPNDRKESSDWIEKLAIDMKRYDESVSANQTPGREELDEHTEDGFHDDGLKKDKSQKQRCKIDLTPC
eukprot:TRINITY_DN5620_c0_g1_i4.p1 TRINITY_DN5620_c0_g1~~TRINITY_DN5620_c0_g1_i4.p1  ORF type:complete len:186 (+),score=45.93 TRINITY_DN5620_c0_g1_i4:25-558(+)